MPRLSPAEKKARAERKAHVDRIAAVVARLRELPLRRPLKVGWIGAKDVKLKARKAIDKELGKEWLEGYTAAFARLGLLPQGYPYAEALLEILGEQVAGFYDSDEKELFVRHDMPADEMVLAHEIGHALQDQHFDLEKLQGDIKVNEDRNFGVTALVEGDATLVMEAYIKDRMNVWKAMKLLGSAFRMAAMDSPKLDAAPLFIREGMVRPYMDGWAFVKNLHAMGGQAAVDKAFRRPPASSEQVLHPEKYLANEAPLKVAVLNLLPVLGKGWKVLHENTLGEFGVNILLRTAKLGSSVIGPAARGWGGDRFRAYRHEDGRVTLYWRTMWDSGRDAREFFDAYAGLLKRRFSSAAVTSKSDAGGQSALTLQVQQGERRIWCTLRGSEVSILDGDLDAPPHLPGAKPVQ